MKTKAYLNIDELIKVIKDKGININDEEYVRNILKQNNYYVIIGYKTCKYLSICLLLQSLTYHVV